jgi:hypothetical protein
MRVLAEEMPELFVGDLERDVVTGLGKLSSETNPLTKETIPDIADRLLYRKFGALLAFALHKLYSSRGVKIPSEILEWKKICSDAEEFAEIRNAWIDLAN